MSTGEKYCTTLGKAEAKALLGCVEKPKSHRDNLKNIAFWADGTAAATDGICLMMRVGTRPPTEARSAPYLMSSADLDRAAKLASAKQPIEIEFTSEGYTLKIGDAALDGTLIEADFPPVWNVMRESKTAPEHHMAWSADVMARLSRLMSGLMRGRKARIVDVRIAGPLDPVHLRCTSDAGEQWLAIVMPMRR